MLEDLKDEPLHRRAKRDAKAKMLFPQSFLRKGVSLGYVGLNQNLKDLNLGGLGPWGLSSKLPFLKCKIALFQVGGLLTIMYKRLSKKQKIIIYSPRTKLRTPNHPVSQKT